MVASLSFVVAWVWRGFGSGLGSWHVDHVHSFLLTLEVVAVHDWLLWSLLTIQEDGFDDGVSDRNRGISRSFVGVE